MAMSTAYGCETQSPSVKLLGVALIKLLLCEEQCHPNLWLVCFICSQDIYLNINFFRNFKLWAIMEVNTKMK